MSEYREVEQPFLQALDALGWTVVDQGADIPQDATRSLRRNFREWLLPDVFAASLTRLNETPDGKPWLTPRQMEDLHAQITRQPNHSLRGRLLN